MEGVWGNNRVNGYIAIDDVTFFPGKCESKSFYFEFDFSVPIPNVTNQLLFMLIGVPSHASLSIAECTFDRDSCNWRNTSNGDFEWRMATLQV